MITCFFTPDQPGGGGLYPSEVHVDNDLCVLYSIRRITEYVLIVVVNGIVYV